MKAVLISIQPKWCELIANGKKTIEVRKDAPKLNTPFKAYIYCTKPRKFIHGYPDDELFRHIDGRIECGFSFQITTERGVFTKDNFLSGKVIGEFVCDRIDEYVNHFMAWRDKNGKQFNVGEFLSNACVTLDEVSNYIAGSIKFYGWHISDLKIYDKPKELGEFKKGCNDMYDPMYGSYCGYCEKKCYLKRAPQSWGYVEVQP